MSNISSRGRGRPRTGEEVEAGPLLTAALDAFAESGYDGMSVRALSRRLCISHALITARFGSKEQLWYAAIEHAMADSVRVWTDATDSEEVDDLEALRQGLVSQVLWAASYPQVVRIMNHEGGIDSPRVRFVVDRFINPLRPGIERLLDRLISAGRVRPVPYLALHYLVLSGTSGPFALPVEARLLGVDVPSTPADLQNHAEAVADIILAGIMTRRD